MSEGEVKKFDSNEFELPETVLVRDIENRVFQSIILHCLSRIEGVGLAEGNFIDNLLGRSATERIKGIHVEQDSKKQGVSVRVDVSIEYGHPIPEKAAEIQRELTSEITRMTGLHVACVHVVFRNIAVSEPAAQLLTQSMQKQAVDQIEEEYSDEF